MSLRYCPQAEKLPSYFHTFVPFFRDHNPLEGTKFFLAHKLWSEQISYLTRGQTSYPTFFVLVLSYVGCVQWSVGNVRIFISSIPHNFSSPHLSANFCLHFSSLPHDQHFPCSSHPLSHTSLPLYCSTSYHICRPQPHLTKFMWTSNQLAMMLTIQLERCSGTT